MNKNRTIKDFKEQIANFKSVTPWVEIKENEVYHIPPIISLERREIMILEKNGNKAIYCKIGGDDKDEHTLFETSVFAKFMVKRKKF